MDFVGVQDNDAFNFAQVTEAAESLLRETIYDDDKKLLQRLNNPSSSTNSTTPYTNIIAPPVLPTPTASTTSTIANTPALSSASRTISNNELSSMASLYSSNFDTLSSHSTPMLSTSMSIASELADHANATTMFTLLNGSILCLSNIRGRLSDINRLAAEKNVKAIIHCGDFGFFDRGSVERMSEMQVRQLQLQSQQQSSRSKDVKDPAALSELQLFLDLRKGFDIPVYVCYGGNEDIHVVDKFTSGEYHVPNLYLIHECKNIAFEVPAPVPTIIRLFGLGGCISENKLFDHAEGLFAQAGGDGQMWPTMLQIGQLLKLAQEPVSLPSQHPMYQYGSPNASTSASSSINEIRILVTSEQPQRKAIIGQISMAVRADYLIYPATTSSNGRYPLVENLFDPALESMTKVFADRCIESSKLFDKLYARIKDDVESSIDDSQRDLLNYALSVMKVLPHADASCWAFGLPSSADTHAGVVFTPSPNDGCMGVQLFGQGPLFANQRRQLSQQSRLPHSSYSSNVFALSQLSTPPTSSYNLGLYQQPNSLPSSSSYTWEPPTRATSQPRSQSLDQSLTVGSFSDSTTFRPPMEDVRGRSRERRPEEFDTRMKFSSPHLPPIGSNMTTYQPAPSTTQPASQQQSNNNEGIIIWVGNLSDNTTEKDLRAFFRLIKVTSLRLVTGNPDKRPCAFVEVPDTETMERALRLSGERCNGNRLRVEYDPSKVRGLKRRTLSVPTSSSSSSNNAMSRSESFEGSQPIPTTSANSSSYATPEMDSVALPPHPPSSASSISAASKTPSTAILSTSAPAKPSPTTPGQPPARATWDSPPRKNNQSFSTGATWDKPVREPVAPNTTYIGWDSNNPRKMDSRSNSLPPTIHANTQSNNAPNGWGMNMNGVNGMNMGNMGFANPFPQQAPNHPPPPGLHKPGMNMNMNMNGMNMNMNMAMNMNMNMKPGFAGRIPPQQHQHQHQPQQQPQGAWPTKPPMTTPGASRQIGGLAGIPTPSAGWGVSDNMHAGQWR